MDFNAIGRPSVLAVDDQRANLLALEAALGSEFNVVTANSGPEAISILESRSDIDVILMDVQMPVMDGFEAASRIKTIKGCEDIPIVLITAIYHEDPFIKQGYQVGAVDYFTKPFDPDIMKLKLGIYASFRQKANVLKERARQVREAEELLRAGKKLSALLERPRVGVVLTDPAGRIRQANAEALEFLGELVRGDGRLIGELPAAVAAALEGHGAGEARLEVMCAGTVARSLLWTASPLRDLDRSIVGALLVFHDVTERKQAQREMETRLGRLAGVEPVRG